MAKYECQDSISHAKEQTLQQYIIGYYVTVAFFFLRGTRAFLYHCAENTLLLLIYKVTYPQATQHVHHPLKLPETE